MCCARVASTRCGRAPPPRWCTRSTSSHSASAGCGTKAATPSATAWRWHGGTRSGACGRWCRCPRRGYRSRAISQLSQRSIATASHGGLPVPGGRPRPPSFCQPLIIREPCFGTRATFQGDQDMTDQSEAKTKTIGFLPVEKVQTLKGWDEYVEKSTKLSVLRTEAQR